MSEVNPLAAVERSAAARSMERERARTEKAEESPTPEREREPERRDRVTLSHEDDTRPENHPQYNERAQVSRRG